MNLLLFSVLIVLLFGVFSVAAVLEPTEVNRFYYWLSILWVALLFSLNWFASAAIFASSGEGERRRVFGGLPGLNFLVTFFSFFSLGTLAGYWLGWLDTKSHFAIQLGILAVGLATNLVVFVAVKGAETSSRDFVPRTRLENSVESFLLRSERLLDRNSKEAKELIEFISFKMPHPAKLKQEDLRQAIQDLEVEARSKEHGRELLIQVLERLKRA